MNYLTDKLLMAIADVFLFGKQPPEFSVEEQADVYAFVVYITSIRNKHNSKVVNLTRYYVEKNLTFQRDVIE